MKMEVQLLYAPAEQTHYTTQYKNPNDIRLSVAAIWNFWTKIQFIRYHYLTFVLFTVWLQKGVFFCVSHIQYDSSLKLSDRNMRSIKVSILVLGKAIRLRQMKCSHLNSQRNRQT